MSSRINQSSKEVLGYKSLIHTSKSGGPKRFREDEAPMPELDTCRYNLRPRIKEAAESSPSRKQMQYQGSSSIQSKKMSGIQTLPQRSQIQADVYTPGLSGATQQQKLRSGRSSNQSSRRSRGAKQHKGNGRKINQQKDGVDGSSRRRRQQQEEILTSSGRPRGTTPADDRYNVLQARRNRRQTAGEIARHTTQVTGRPISRFTVARRLHGGGLFARRPVRCVPLTPAYRRRRSLWCREHRNCRNHPSNNIERDRYGCRGVLVWGGIMLGSRTDLHIFDASSVNGTRYCNEILLPYVRLFRSAMGLQFLFMDGNVPCHHTVAAEQLLESADIERMDWPARSRISIPSSMYGIF
ncbi:transposable element Tc3 transposase [Trichonephila clavipes]|nr:transposable element Tc3 transposase [Trichonephila clavipes]